MQPRDYHFAAELANTMKWDTTEEDFAFSQKLEPNGCFILQENKKTVGIATCISYGGIGWFGNLIVEPTCRRKGAGTLLVKHAINYLQGIGVKTVGLYAYEHLVDFYSLAGFKPDCDFTVLKAVKVTAAEKENLPQAKKKNFPSILKLDGECFSADRQKMLNPILQDKSNFFAVSKDANGVSGFAAAKIYSGLAEVGPLVCRRNQTADAKRLLSAVLGRISGLEAWMCVPSADSALLRLALDAGFTIEFGVVRMFLGSIIIQNCSYIAESLERG